MKYDDWNQNSAVKWHWGLRFLKKNEIRLWTFQIISAYITQQRTAWLGRDGVWKRNALFVKGMHFFGVTLTRFNMPKSHYLPRLWICFCREKIHLNSNIEKEKCVLHNRGFATFWLPMLVEVFSHKCCHMKCDYCFDYWLFS